MLVRFWTSLQGMNSSGHHTEDACHFLLQIPLSSESVFFHQPKLIDFDLKYPIYFCIHRSLLRLLTRLKLGFLGGDHFWNICLRLRIFGFFELGLSHLSIEVRHTSLCIWSLSLYITIAQPETFTFFCFCSRLSRSSWLWLITCFWFSLDLALLWLVSWEVPLWLLDNLLFAC